jgi:hypothetical protein
VEEIQLSNNWARGHRKWTLNEGTLISVTLNVNLDVPWLWWLVAGLLVGFDLCSVYCDTI